MMRSLWTAASGMIGQQFNIDTIANNLSNVNTTGFKKNRPDFEDLLYQTVRMAGTPATEETLVPVGVQVGHGVKVAATQKIFTQGSLQNTNNISDVAIQGEGFFRVLLYDGTGPGMTTWFGLVAVSFVSLAVGWWIFSKLSPRFAEEA